MALPQLTTKLQWPKQSGRCLDSGFLAGMLKTLSVMFPRYGDMINRHERRLPQLLDYQTVNNAATLDVGDNNGSALWNDYDFLLCRLSYVRPVVDGDYMFMRYGGGGSWWSAANYNYQTSSTSGTGQTEVQLFANTAAMRQGNVIDEDFFSNFVCELALGDSEQGARPCMGEMTWADINTSPLRSNVAIRYPTTSHLSALRFWYNGGNIYGKAALWGIPRGI